MKNISVKVLATIAFIGFILMASDCEDMDMFYKSKIIGATTFALAIIGIKIINSLSKYHKY